LARWLHVENVQHGRRQEALKQEREERRDSDESEKSQSIGTQQEIEDWRGTERNKALAESAAAASSQVAQVLSPPSAAGERETASEVKGAQLKLAATRSKAQARTRREERL
jgi:hypothetical protein